MIGETSCVKKMVDDMNVADMQDVDGASFPKQAALKQSFEMANGQTVFFSYDTTVSNVVINPDFEKDDPFFITATDGVPIQTIFPDNSVVSSFEWRNGRISPLVDKSVLDDIDDTVAAVLESGALENLSENSETQNSEYRASEESTISKRTNMYMITAALLLLVFVSLFVKRYSTSREPDAKS